MLKHLDLFSGIGGFALAARMVGGIKTAQFVEIEPYCQRVLAKNFPGVPIYDDIRTFTAIPGSYDLITGGFPCQDNSTANQNGRGLDGSRSGLWFEMLRIIQQSEPKFVVVENIPPTINRRWELVVRSELEALGYKTEPLDLSAKSLGANHLRERLFIIAYPHSLWGFAIKNPSQKFSSEIQSRSPSWWEKIGELRRGNSGRVFLLPRSWVGRVDDGLPSKLDADRIRGLGNAVVPQVATIALKRVLTLSNGH